MVKNTIRHYRLVEFELVNSKFEVTKITKRVWEWKYMPQKFKYQLTKGMDLHELRRYLEPFLQYNKIDDVCVVETDMGFALFTEGKDIKKTNYRTPHLGMVEL